MLHAQAQHERPFVLSGAALQAARNKAAERRHEAQQIRSMYTPSTASAKQDACVSVNFTPHYSAEQYKRFLAGSAVSVARARHAAFSQSLEGTAAAKPFQDKQASRVDQASPLRSPVSSISAHSTVEQQQRPAGRHKLYKTELCRNWQEAGTCRYQTRCQFAHGPGELRDSERHCKYKVAFPS
jgi:Tfp pilus assembly protein PilV